MREAWKRNRYNCGWYGVWKEKKKKRVECMRLGLVFRDLERESRPLNFIEKEIREVRKEEGGEEVLFFFLFSIHFSFEHFLIPVFVLFLT